MYTLLKHVNILDGTLNMKVQENQDILIEDGTIIGIGANIICEKAKEIDLTGKYVTPGLINLHVHLPSSGKIEKKKLGDKKPLVKLILSTRFTRYLGLLLEKSGATKQLLSGVTTIRSVGGVADFDSRLRDKINSGKWNGPRVLASNYAICTPGGHMGGTVSKEVNSIEEAINEVVKLKEMNSDLIKIMITGGILDCKEIGHPGDLKMNEEMVKAICDKSHELGLKVAAHVEGPEGVRIAIQNGVDSIEHGSDVTEELLEQFKQRNGAFVVTFAPALPFVHLDTVYGEVGKINAIALVKSMTETGKKCVKAGCSLGIGTDAGSAYSSQYDTYRELIYINKLLGVSPSFAIYTATLKNAEIAGIDNITGSIETTKSADLVVLDKNPLEDLFAFANPYMVIARGKVFTKKVKKMDDLEEALKGIKL